MPMIRGTSFSIGADPEVFLKEKGGRRRFRGAWWVTQGTKRYPERLPWPAFGGVQVDGFALEFNTTPATGQRQFVREVVSCKQAIKNYLLHRRNLRFAVESTVEFDAEEWRRAPYINRQLGCDPDYSAYTLDLNPTPNQDVTCRTAAGHIHIGWGRRFDIDAEYIKLCAAIAKEMDATLGLASLLFDPDTKRRSLYGKAGAFRPKSYGVEYRVLSNRWIKNIPLMRYVYNLSFLAIKRLMNKVSVHTEEVQGIIDGDHKEMAKDFLIFTACPLPPIKERLC